MVDVEHDVDRDISAAESDQGSQEKNHENSVNEEAGPGEDTVHTTQAIESLSPAPLPSASLRYVNVGGNFFTGIDISSEEAVKKRSLRAQRFGLKEEDCSNSSALLSTLKARANRFGTKPLEVDGELVKVIEKLPDIPSEDAEVRLEGVLMHGTDDMSTKDVLGYFKVYGPRNVEWINDKSCVIVWDDIHSAKRALLGLGKRPAVNSQAMEEMEEEEEEEESKTGESSSEDKDGVQTASKSSIGWRWRVGEPHAMSKQILLRYATTLDKKGKNCASISEYYRKYGNPNVLPSGSPPLPLLGQRKRKMGDLRQRIGKKGTWRVPDANEEEKKEEGGEEEEEERREEPMEVEEEEEKEMPAKRHCSLYSDRIEAKEEEEEKEGGTTAAARQVPAQANDLRHLVQNKLKSRKKRKELLLRIGSNPRLVLEHNT